MKRRMEAEGLASSSGPTRKALLICSHDVGEPERLKMSLYGIIMPSSYEGITIGDKAIGADLAFTSVVIVRTCGHRRSLDLKPETNVEIRLSDMHSTFHVLEYNKTTHSPLVSVLYAPSSTCSI